MPPQEEGIFEGMTVDQVINNLINGEALFDSERIMDNLINLFLMEVKGSVFLGCEILAICIVTGLLSNFPIHSAARQSRLWGL